MIDAVQRPEHQPDRGHHGQHPGDAELARHHARRPQRADGGHGRAGCPGRAGASCGRLARRSLPASAAPTRGHGPGHQPEQDQVKIGIETTAAVVQPSIVSSMAQSTDPSARIEPTDRSMPPVRMTSVIPTATMPLLDTWRSTLEKVARAEEDVDAARIDRRGQHPQQQQQRQPPVELGRHEETQQHLRHAGASASRTGERLGSALVAIVSSPFVTVPGPGRRARRACRPTRRGRAPGPHRRARRSRGSCRRRIPCGPARPRAGLRAAPGSGRCSASSSGSSELATTMAMPCAGEPADQPVDLGLGADVDAAGRLVEQQDARGRSEPPADDHLLLVAARQRADRRVGRRRLDRQPVDGIGAPAPLARPRSTRPSAGQASSSGQGDVARDRGIARNRPVALAVLGDQGQPGRMAAPAASGTDRLAVDAGSRRPRPRRGGAEQGLEQLGPAGAEQPGDAQHLAGGDVEGRAVDQRGRRSRPGSASHSPAPPARAGRPGAAVAGRRLAAWKNSCDVAADHQPDQPGPRGLGDRRGRRRSAPSRSTVTRSPSVEDLVHPVRDVDDGHALAGRARR